jgi:hypothetical protein
MGPQGWARQWAIVGVSDRMAERVRECDCQGDEEKTGNMMESEREREREREIERVVKMNREMACLSPCASLLGRGYNAPRIRLALYNHHLPSGATGFLFAEGFLI